MTSPIEPTLVIFVKKTALYMASHKLAAEIGAEKALLASEYMLDCAMEDASNWRGDVVVSPANKKDGIWAQGLLSRKTMTLPQPEGNFGERLQTIDKRLRLMGHSQIIYIRTDSPALKTSHYSCAQVGFQKNDVVLGRSNDSGITMIASKKPFPELSELPWGTRQLGNRLLEACESASLRVDIFSGGYNVESKNDLERLKTDLFNDPRPARSKLYYWLKYTTKSQSVDAGYRLVE